MFKLLRTTAFKEVEIGFAAAPETNCDLVGDLIEQKVGAGCGVVVDIVVSGPRLVKQLADADPNIEWLLEYSPESFTGTELEFAGDICAVVCDV